MGTASDDKAVSIRLGVFCARYVLPVFEAEHPGDERPRKAIEAVEAWCECPCGEHGGAVEAAMAAVAAVCATPGGPRATATAVHDVGDAVAASAPQAAHDAADAANCAPRSRLRSRRRLRLPHHPNVRRWLGGGSWNECLTHAGLESTSDGDFVSLPQTDAYEEHELVVAIRDCGKNHHGGQIPSLGELNAWARQPEIQARPGRRPLSWTPFKRFGGYRAVLVRNGLIAPDSAFLDRRGRVMPLSQRYDDDELRGAVRSVRDRLGVWPHEVQYTEERAKIMDESRQSESPVTLPAAMTLCRRFGRWPAVLQQAAAEPGATSGGVPIGRRPRYTKQEKAEWLRRAWTAIGQPFSESRYQAWRIEKIEAAQRGGEFLEIPSVTAFYSTYGTWGKACEAELPPDVKLWKRRR